MERERVGASCGFDALIPNGCAVNAHRERVRWERELKKEGGGLRSVASAIFELVGIVVGRNVLGSMN